MPLSLVTSVSFNTRVVDPRSERRQPAVRPQLRRAAKPPADPDEAPNAAANEDDDDSGIVSTAGLSILAQALAAYSEN
jgi:hypothetical protein